MATVTINGNTYSDDSNATTGLASGGHRTRFIPLIQDVVAVAGSESASAASAAAAALSQSAAATSASAAGNSAAAAAISAGQAEAFFLGNTFDHITALAGITPTLFLDFAQQDYRIYSAATGLERKPLADFLTFTRASNGGIFNAQGLYEALTSNAPRLDFDPETGVCRGLLIEESRTNLLLNSSAAGTNLATQSITVAASAYTLSFYGTGTVTLSGTYSGSLVGSGAYPTRSTLTFTPTAGTLTLTVSGTVQYANCELGAFATSFIPTAGTAVTRLADNASMTGANFSSWYNQTEGTVVVDAQPNSGIGYPNAIVDIDDGTVNNNIQIRKNNNYTVIALIAYLGLGQETLYSGLYTFSQKSKVAFGFKTDDQVLYHGGSLIEAGLTINMPTVNILRIGKYLPSTYLNGTIARLTYFPKRLSNAQLQQLSALGV
jgi:hypothetical protein